MVRKFALALRAVDYPGGRREQAEGIPRLGGVAVVLGLFVSQAALSVIDWGMWSHYMSPAETIAVPLAFLLIFVCGLLEDTIGISPILRIAMQIAAAVVVMRVGWCFEGVYVPFIGSLDFGILSCAISLVWIVGVTNAINLLDGLDGLAGGVVSIIAAGLLVFSLGTGDYVAAMIMGTIVGACLGFLRKNWAPAQIYLGDAGSLTLGFMLAVVSVHSSLKTSAVIAILIPILSLGLPVIDTLLVMLFRFTQKSHGPLVRRAGRMFVADRSHLHHLMLRLGPNRSRIVMVIYAVAVVFCGLALVVATYRNAALGFLLIAFEVVVVVVIRQLGLNADVFRMSLDKRQMVREILFRRRAGER